MSLLNNIRNKLYVSAAIAATAAGAYFNPVPIANNWGEIAVNDLAAKVGLVEQVKEEVKTYGRNKNWNAYEMLNETLNFLAITSSMTI